MDAVDRVKRQVAELCNNSYSVMNSTTSRGFNNDSHKP